MRRTIGGGYTAEGSPGGEILGGEMMGRTRGGKRSKSGGGLSRGFTPQGWGRKEGVIFPKGRDRGRGVLRGRGGRALSTKRRECPWRRFLSTGSGSVVSRGRGREGGV